jgi:hypothetical protein
MQVQCSHRVRTNDGPFCASQTKRLQIRRADARTRTGDLFITREVPTRKARNEAYVGVILFPANPGHSAQSYRNGGARIVTPFAHILITQKSLLAAGGPRLSLLTTSGVTGRSRYLRSGREQAGITGESREFRSLRCGDFRVHAGASPDLVRDVRGMQGCLGCRLAAPPRDPVVVPGLRQHRHVEEERPGFGRSNRGNPRASTYARPGQVQPTAWRRDRFASRARNESCSPRKGSRRRTCSSTTVRSRRCSSRTCATGRSR